MDPTTYVHYTAVLVSGNPLCSYCGNLKNVCLFILYLHSGAHSKLGSPNVYVFVLHCSISAWKLFT